MKPYRKIMVACDLSSHSLPALRHAAMLAGKLGARLVIVNVINRKDYEAMVGAMPRIAQAQEDMDLTPDDYMDDVKKDRLVEIKKLVELVECENLVAKITFPMGNPYEELMAAIAEEGADVLIMGTKGRGNLASVLLGSTAEKMFHHCPVPLLSIRPENKQ